MEGTLSLKILLVDKDEDWLSMAKSYFEGFFYRTTLVNNGRDAQMALYREAKFFAAIINTRIEGYPSTQVLRFIKANHPTLKVLMITKIDEMESLEDQLTPEKLKKMGATEVVTVPFEMDSLKEILEGHQSFGDMVSSISRREGVGKEEEVNLGDDQFTSVKIDEFYSSRPVLFDVFIRLKSNRYIKILHAGDGILKERLDKYRNEKKVEFLYFHKKDLAKFVKFNSYVTKKVVNNVNVGGKKKLKLLQNVSEKFLEQTFEEGMKPQIIDQGKEIAETMFELVTKSKDLFKVFRSYADFDPNIYTHAYLVSLFTTSIIKQFEWQSKVTIERTALACLFHDIGKMKMDPVIARMKVEDMSAGELREYKKHPEYGIELIDGNSLINNPVKQIIFQHHEHFDGSGFPFKKRGPKILMLSNIVCLADNFVHIIQDEDRKPLEALKILLNRKDELRWYNSIVVERLIQVFIDPQKIVKSSNLPASSRVFSSKKGF